MSGWVIKVSNLTTVENNIHTEYRLETCDGMIAAAGRLDVLRLVRADGGYPSFSARWDQNKDTLDIDMHHRSKIEIDDFKHARNGYGGHWTKRPTDPDSRAFEIAIKTPDGLIFDGAASFAVTRHFQPSDEVQVGDHIDAEVVSVR